MHYHLRLVLADGQKIYKVDGGLDWYKENILIPLFNKQTVLLTYRKSEFIISMSSVCRLYFFKTDFELFGKNEKELSDLFDSPDFIKHNCTKEILNLIKVENSSTQSKSLLEKSFSTIENQVFVIMKFGDEELDSAYEGVIEPCIKNFRLKPIRVDKIQDSGKINDQILEHIAKSKLIIADLSGERPNCYYETGFAHALGKEIILTIREKEKIHFDLNAHRFITWKTEADFRKKLEERFKSILKEQ
jgi:nucleoside 2-deoxyribosyltransferase